MKIAYDGSSRCAKTMINHALKRSPLPIYKLNKCIMVRYPYAGKRTPKRRFGISGVIIVRDIPLSKYHIRYRNPDTKIKEENWVIVNDIMSKTAKKESE